MREMKDSGVPWIGVIPKHWEIGKVRKYYRFQTGFTPASENSDYYDDNGAEWITISDLNGGYYIPSRTKQHISQSYIEAFNPSICPNGSLLYSFKLSVGQVAMVNRDIYSNEAIACFLPNAYLGFLFYSSSLIEYNAQINIYGARLLNQKRIYGAPIVYPPLQEQYLITRFLDKKCAEINSIIDSSQKSIIEYQKLKQSIISDAVSRGIRGNRPMKESGVEWIGATPEEWNVIKIKWLLLERNSRSEDGHEEPLSMSQKYGLIPTKDMDVVPNMASSFVGAKKVSKGDLVFNKLKAHLGVFAVSEYDGLVSPDYAVYYSAGRCDVKYLERVFKTPQYISEFRKRSTGVGAGLTRLYTSDLFDMYTALPSESEQQEITAFLDNKCATIDSLIASKEALISELEAYKKSLIFEYVTGKKEVPVQEGGAV